MTIETELKLRIAPENIEQFLQHPLLQTATQTAAQDLINIYFDTPAHDLLQHGVGLRIRQIGDKKLQTLKTTGSSLGGLHQRQEWEFEITGDEPDYKKLPRQAFPKQCAKVVDSIIPLFTTHFHRTTWELCLTAENKVEIALDQGEIKTQTDCIALHEIELELKSGEVSALYQIALTLQDDLPLIVENRSKAQRGYALHRPESLKVYKAGEVALHAEMTTEQAFTTILWHCLAHLQANEAMVLYGQDSEGVHQMRVALRRLRTCLSLYKSLVAKASYTEIYQELKWIAQILGNARDLDVLEAAFKTVPTTDLNQAEWFALQTTVTNQQQQAYTTVREALNSPRYSRLLLSLGEWITQSGWRLKAKPAALQRLQRPVKKFVSKVLDKQHESICQQSEALSVLPAEQRHQLRLKVKKLAYAMRFFAPLYTTKEKRAYTRCLSQLREELGLLNDIHVARQWLDRTATRASIQYFLRGWYSAQQMIHLTHLEATWQTLQKQKIFWK